MRIKAIGKIIKIVGTGKLFNSSGVGRLTAEIKTDLIYDDILGCYIIFE
jgi:hypothetical protein